ncbi:fused MFS/spermidine synthase, partial [Oligoflexia bacterium]|nr:fused MFS/spermidine synthase [Oligoflexia bacterium]
LAGRILAKRRSVNALKVYAALELAIGLAGILLTFGFSQIAAMDVWLFQYAPSATPLAHCLGIIVVLAIPTLAMGATVPVFALIARRYHLSLPRLYGWNVAGATVGVLLASFILFPLFGISLSTGFTSVINIVVALAVFMLGSRKTESPTSTTAAIDCLEGPRVNKASLGVALSVVFATGFASFNLEVAWFRALRAAFQATTESFALVLSAVLLALAVGAQLAPILRRKRYLSIEYILTIAGVLVLVATPIIERIDILVLLAPTQSYLSYTLVRFALALLLLGIPMTLIGIGLPWFLEEYGDPRQVSILYGINTIGAVLGSLLAAWLLLPTIGFAATAWIAGLALILPALIMTKRDKLLAPVLLTLIGLVIAVSGKSELGRTRVQTSMIIDNYTVLASSEGPDSTVSVIGRTDGTRDLLIDGFTASSTEPNTQYMIWMGRLPMILHPDPKDALVICFGTGQTAHAVRDEGLEKLDIVDVNEAVFEMAHYFDENHGILKDPRVTAITMDGRAWLRRSEALYDVITLEPMPPTFAGSNSLYSLEFYQLSHAKLRPGGVFAQWLPFHLVGPFEAASITRTFMEVFPQTLLWLDPVSSTGILLGLKSPAPTPFAWHGFSRAAKDRGLTPEQVRMAPSFHQELLAPYAKFGAIISDDSQLLAYGYGRSRFAYRDQKRLNLHILEQVINSPPMEITDSKVQQNAEGAS